MLAVQEEAEVAKDLEHPQTEDGLERQRRHWQLQQRVPTNQKSLSKVKIEIKFM